MMIINVLKNAHQILEGHLHEIKDVMDLTTERKKKIYRFRENICNSCPLKSNNFCDFTKWINPITKNVSSKRKKGYFRGCGCRLSAKQKAFNAQCPAGFWGGEELILKKVSKS